MSDTIDDPVVLREMIVRMRRALEFYADKHNYYEIDYMRTGDGDEMMVRGDYGGPISEDLGKIARDALSVDK